MSTVEQTKEQIALLEQVLANEQKIGKLSDQQLDNLTRITNLLKDDYAIAKKNIETAKERLALLKDEEEPSKHALLMAERRLDREEAVLKVLKNRKKELTQTRDIERLITGELKEQQKARVKAHDEDIKSRKKAIATTNAQREAVGKLETASKGAAALTRGIGDIIGENIKQSMTTSNELLSQFGPEVILAKYLGFEVNFKNIQKSISDLPKELDTAFTGMAAKTAMPIKTLGNSLASALDPQGAADGIEGYAESLRKLNLTRADMPLVNVGMKTEDVTDALGGLIENAALFRTEFMETEPAVVSLTTNLIAGLKKVGVNTKTSAKIFDVFTKGFKKTPIEATKSLKSVANIADSLGISMGKAFGNFEAAMPTLSQFGDRMTEVFANLQARSAATGAEMGKLVGIAMKMDTFEGAAKAAQSLNGILGDTLISVTDLVHADPDEKFDLIADAVKNSGLEFESLNRHYKRSIATAAGFSDVAEFQRQLYGGEAVTKAKDAADTSAMSAEKLAEKTKQTLTIQEKAKASVSSFGVAAKKAYETSKIAADAYSTAVLRSYEKNLELTKNQEASFIAAKEMLLVNSRIEDSLEGAAETVGNTVRGLATVGVATGVVGSVLRGDRSDAAKEAMRDRDAAGNRAPAAAAGPGGSVKIEGATVANLDPGAGTALIEFFGEVYDEKRNAEMAKAAEHR